MPLLKERRDAAVESLKIGKRVLEVPIIQGGMGVGVSLDGLAGAVAACGGMGVISSAFAGLQAEGFDEDPKGVTLREIPKLVQSAKEKAQGKGLVGINIMCAVSDYTDHVEAAIKGGVDAIISGAGLPLNLPKIAGDANVLLAPIVSGGRVMKLIGKAWERHHKRYPDFVVVEGAPAGGHLGFPMEELKENTSLSPVEILREVLAELAPLEEKAGRKIPAFLAGGIFSYEDVEEALAGGASGVQIGTRFIATAECDVDQVFKDVLIAAEEEDIVLTLSPVGMPGRAINSPLVKFVAEGGRKKAKRCVDCLTPCDPAKTPYCISEALIASARGDFENGLFFAGSKSACIKELTTVPALMAELSGKELA